MRIGKTQKNHKKIISILSSVVAIAALFAIAWFSPGFPYMGNKGDSPENTVSHEPASDEQKTAGEKAKESFVKGKYSESPAGNSNPKSTLKIDINFTSIGQADSFLQIRATINSTDSVGACELTLSKSGMSDIVSHSDVQSMGAYSVCKGFDIPESDLVAGEWLAKLKYSREGTVPGEISRKIQVTR